MIKTNRPIVFIVADLTLRGGIERVLVNTANYLSSIGVKCIIISIFRTYDRPYYTISDSAHVLYLSSISFSRAKHWFLPTVLIARSGRFIAQLKAHRVVVYHPSYIVPVVQFCRVENFRIVYSEHMSFGAANPALDLLRKLILKKIHCIHVLNMASKKYYNKLGINALVIPNSVTNFPHSEQFKSRLITHKSPTNSLRVLAVGRLDPVKSFSHVIKAAAYMVSFPNIIFKIVGDGPEFQRLFKLIQKAKLNNITISPGSIRMEEYYMNYDCILITSVSESFSMVLLEAMSFGIVPICYSDLDGPTDIVEQGNNGFLVGRGDYHSISIRLNQISNDVELLTKLSNNAVNTSLMYTCNNIYPRICEMLELANLSNNE